MVSDLINYLRNHNDKMDLKTFKFFLEQCVTTLGSDLYWVVVYYEEQEKAGNFACSHFITAYKEARSVIFEQRSSLHNVSWNEEFHVSLFDWFVQTHQIFNQLYNDMLYVAACTREQDKWVVNANVLKQTSGVLNNWFSDLITFSQYIKDNDVLNGCIGGLVLEPQSHKKKKGKRYMKANISGAGKGSGRRPTLVNASTANDNWERIFGKKEDNFSKTQWLYKFCNFFMDNDEVDEKTGKIKTHREVNVVASSLEAARIKGKVRENWVLVSEERLGKDWR